MKRWSLDARSRRRKPQTLCGGGRKNARSVGRIILFSYRRLLEGVNYYSIGAVPSRYRIRGMGRHVWEANTGPQKHA
jgi:hypothetical protein